MLRSQLILSDEAYAIVGALMEVHTQLGPGFLEPVYQEATAIELALRAIPFEPLKRLKIRYKQFVLEKEYVADFVCYGQIIVELKAQDVLTSRDEAQLLNYLAATNFRLGLL